jgi:Ni/Co efflux regulator RcnB
MLRELLTMKKLLFAGVAATLACAAAPSQAANDSFAVGPEKAASKLNDDAMAGARRGRPGPVAGVHHPRPGMGQGNHRWGNRVNGRWSVGFGAPGGWGGYRQPFRGYVLPSYWINPGYSLGNYATYGLYAPMTGYGWTRYYDDAVLSDYRGNVYDHRTGIDWNRYEGGYAPEGYYPKPEYAPSIAPDRQVYDVNSGYDSDTYESYESDVEYRQGTGAPYASPPVARGPYQPQANHGYAPPAPAYRTPAGYDRYERCLKDRGVAGGVIGAVVGAVAGNRIAGRGDRLAGSLIGGGVGAIAGLGIEKATNKCRRYLPQQQAYYPQQGQSGYPAPYPAQQAPAYPHGYGQQGGYYQQGYYYYPQPAPVITTITVSPAVTTTTTVTEEYYYETVPVRRKAVRKVARKARPAPKPRCGCR